MSSHLDDLARALVTPTSRRRAFRLFGSAVLVAAVPALRPGRALGKGVGLKCPPGTTLCSNGKGSEVCVEAGGDCCIYPEAVVGCKAGTKCGGSINNACIAACKTKLCGPRKECCTADRECVQFSFAPGGKTYESCARKCERGSRRCRGRLECCPNTQNCCNGLCCGPEQVCVRALNRSGDPTRLCKRECQAPQARCNFICCDADKRAYRKLPNGRIKCHCVNE